MKKFLFPIGLLACAAAGASAQTVVLSGTLTADRTLYSDTCYHMQGCYVVPDTRILTIQPGTEIRCASGSSLVVERGGMIDAVGTANAPIVFTSDQDLNPAPGHWNGIVAAGKAPNNVLGGTFTVRRCGNDYTAGGSLPADNSGRLKYIRIEYAGGGTVPSEVTYPAALVLASVGTGTEIEFIQTTQSAMSGFVCLGGAFEAKHLLSLDDAEANFRFSMGNISKLQHLLGLRRDANAHTTAGVGASGVVIENDNGGTAATPLTSPAISNLTVLARGYCDESLHTDIEYGIKFDNNGAGNIWNSAIAGYRLEGLFLADAGSVGHTAGNPGLLNFSYNSLMDNLAPQYGNAGWTGGCDLTMGIWITGSGFQLCRETDNDLSPSSFGYHSSICEDYCEDRPTITYSGTNLSSPNFSGVFADAFFDVVNYRGAMGATDWTSNWANFCPQQQAYCSIALLKVAPQAAPLHFVPNPASGSTQVLFEAATTGEAVISLMDKVSGRILQQVVHTVTEPGSQSVTISVKGLLEGVYTVRVAMKDKVQYGQLSVR